MDVARTTAAAIALGRIGFGVAYLARPALAEPTWIGRAGRKPGTQAIVRSLGARDIGIGAGALRALVRRDDEDAVAWLAASALADAVDAAATWGARSAVGTQRAAKVLAVAGGSAAGCTAAAIALRAQR